MDKQQTISITKESFKQFGRDKATRWSAAVAYYAVFALAPLLLLAIAIAGVVFGEQAARGEISNQLSNVMGQQGAQAVQEMIANASGSGNTTASFFGVLGLVFSASAIFMVLKDAMNVMFEVPEEKSGGLVNMIIKRIWSFVLVLMMGALVIASLVASTLAMNLAEMTGNILPATEVLIQILNFIIVAILLGLVFGVLIKVLPDVSIDWKHAFKGGIITGVLFSIAKEAIAIYIRYKSVDSAFGAAGSLVLIMLWVYLSAIVFFFGAEVTYVLWKQDQKETEAAKERRPRSRRARLRHREA